MSTPARGGSAEPLPLTNPVFAAASLWSFNSKLGLFRRATPMRAFIATVPFTAAIHPLKHLDLATASLHEVSTSAEISSTAAFSLGVTSAELSNRDLRRRSWRVGMGERECAACGCDVGTRTVLPHICRINIRAAWVPTFPSSSLMSTRRAPACEQLCFLKTIAKYSDSTFSRIDGLPHQYHAESSRGRPPRRTEPPESVDIQQDVASLSLDAASARAARASVFGGACVPPIFLEKNTQCAVSFSPNGCLPVSEALPERATCAV
ncbi:hypothetical protein B0H13DRAFT_2662317 [Mycena leptocephala]|nr:hypothetical protein B0H13DRAFT_2662317 [Mycena leptocephala]